VFVRACYLHVCTTFSEIHEFYHITIVNKTPGFDAAQVQSGFKRVVCVCVAGHSVLQCVAVCCSVLQCVAVYCSLLQCVKVCYSVL